MKPVIPLPGFNTSKLPRFKDTCCACFARGVRTPMGTYWCGPCLAEAKAFMRLVREGDAAVRAAVVP